MSDTVWYRLSGHVLLRYGSAHLVDPTTAALRIQEDLAQSRILASEDEARLMLGGKIRFRRRHLYRAGAAGVYVIFENVAITYICAAGRFRSRRVRGEFQRSRSGRLHTWQGHARRMEREPV
ncbi:MAG TPA: hypothetical protein VD969_05220 [Symbiobacteriaceae bacterium]|nr:hypothetical protein [Symbiobacteriaceae bacterium]